MKSEKLDLNVPENSRIRVLHSVSNALLDKSEITDEGIVLKGVVSILIAIAIGNVIKDLNRELLLQKENPDSIAVKYDDLYDMTKLEWKKLFSGKQKNGR